MADKTYRDSKDKYLKEKVDTFVLRVPKGKKDEIAEHAKKLGMSLNAYVTALIFADMNGGEPIAPQPAAKKSAPKKAAEKPTEKSEPNVKEKTANVPEVETTDAEPAEEIRKKKMPSFLL